MLCAIHFQHMKPCSIFHTTTVLGRLLCAQSDRLCYMACQKCGRNLSLILWKNVCGHSHILGNMLQTNWLCSILLSGCKLYYDVLVVCAFFILIWNIALRRLVAYGQNLCKLWLCSCVLLVVSCYTWACQPLVHSHLGANLMLVGCVIHLVLNLHSLCICLIKLLLFHKVWTVVQD